MVRLPVCGLQLRLSAPTGEEDLMLLEAPDLDLSVGLALLRRLVQPVNSDFDLTALVVTDYEALLLGLHRATFGDQVKADIPCTTKGCGGRSDVSFEIERYLAHNLPRRPQVVAAISTRPGWFQLNDKAKSVIYKLPTTADLTAVTESPQPDIELMRRCVEEPLPEGALRRKLEKAMEAQAPSLSNELRSRCSKCGTVMRFFFDVQAFVLRELRDQAAFVYQDTHLLALHYHWLEERILKMPRHRRMHYAEMLRGQA